MRKDILYFDMVRAGPLSARHSPPRKMRATRTRARLTAKQATGAVAVAMKAKIHSKQFQALLTHYREDSVVTV